MKKYIEVCTEGKYIKKGSSLHPLQDVKSVSNYKDILILSFISGGYYLIAKNPTATYERIECFLHNEEKQLSIYAQEEYAVLENTGYNS